MLVLTKTATTAIHNLVDRPEIPDGAGLRIATTNDGADRLTVAATTPEQGDQVIEKDGARVFLEAESAEILDDKILDARLDDQGGVKFLVAVQ
jgi:Fe-S cluster assembly iron-binding protein IscA